MAAAIPLVDVSQDEATAAAKVFQACTKSGFFYGGCAAVSGFGFVFERHTPC